MVMEPAMMPAATGAPPPPHETTTTEHTGAPIKQEHPPRHIGMGQINVREFLTLVNKKQSN